MPQFDPELYQNFRPHYPKEIYGLLLKHSLRCESVLELGAGTGISLQNLASDTKGIKTLAIDSDPEMLSVAKQDLSSIIHSTDYLCTQINSEALSQIQTTFDLIQCASAWHWFYQDIQVQDLLNLLNSKGLLFIHEYQFPKSLEHPNLNEQLKRNFNQKWKPLNQKPRGSLREMTQALRISQGFKEISFPKIPMHLTLSAEDFAGHLFSQSRYLDFEKTLTEQERLTERLQTKAFIKEELKAQTVFDFNWTGYLFQKD